MNQDAIIQGVDCRLGCTMELQMSVDHIDQLENDDGHSFSFNSVYS